MLFGVSKIIRKPELEPENWGPGFDSDFEKPKTRYPIPVPGFWYSVFTGIPGTGKIIYIHILFYFLFYV
jgi:hypothetical protein